MTGYDAEPDARGLADMFHFYLACVGFFTAVSGVIVSAVGWAVFGLLLLLWGLAFLCVREEKNA